MSYKVGSTVIIDNTGNIPWAKITGVPLNMLMYGTEMIKGANVNVTAGSGVNSTGYLWSAVVNDSPTAYHNVFTNTFYGTNCSNCNCNCYC